MMKSSKDNLPMYNLLSLFQRVIIVSFYIITVHSLNIQGSLYSASIDLNSYLLIKFGMAISF